MGFVQAVEREGAGIEPRRQPALLDQLARLLEDFAVAFAADARQQGQQGKDARIGGGLERQGRQGMRAPAQAADDMAEPLDRGE